MAARRFEIQTKRSAERAMASDKVNHLARIYPSPPEVYYTPTTDTPEPTKPWKNFFIGLAEFLAVPTHILLQLLNFLLPFVRNLGRFRAIDERNQTNRQRSLSTPITSQPKDDEQFKGLRRGLFRDPLNPQKGTEFTETPMKKVTRPYALPTVAGKDPDLKYISCATMIRLLNGDLNLEQYIIVDCRFPYEYEGGHIRGAINIHTKEGLELEFLDEFKCNSKSLVLIFHCEYSSQKGPSLCRFLQVRDRMRYYYVLKGGYNAFFASGKDFCEPQSYVVMHDANHGDSLGVFRPKFKALVRKEQKNRQLRRLCW